MANATVDCRWVNQIPQRNRPNCPVTYKSGQPCSSKCSVSSIYPGFNMACDIHLKVVNEAPASDLYRKYTPMCPICVNIGCAKPQWLPRIINEDKSLTNTVSPTCPYHADAV